MLSTIRIIRIITTISTYVYIPIFESTITGGKNIERFLSPLLIIDL